MILLWIGLALVAALVATHLAIRHSRWIRSAVGAGFFSVALIVAIPQLPHWEQLLTIASEGTGGPSVTSTVVQLPADAQPELRLLVAGDVGTGDAYEMATARVGADLGIGDPFDALVLLGDNVYPSGDPARLQATVFDPFEPVLSAGAELLPVLGNHDVEAGHGDAQAAALGMPSRWYERRLGDMLFIGLDSTQPDNADQMAWLEQVLAASNARWKIVALHHPPYSAGYHGSDRDVRAAFAPVFERYGVDLVLAGHDHDYQRSIPINGVTYVVTGAGAKTRPTNSADFTAVSYSTRHVVEIGVWPNRLELRAVNQDGVFDHAVLNYEPATLPAGCSAAADVSVLVP